MSRAASAVFSRGWLGGAVEICLTGVRAKLYDAGVLRAYGGGVRSQGVEVDCFVILESVVF